MLLNLIRSRMREKPDREFKEEEGKGGREKSSSFKEFVHKPETQRFIKRWHERRKGGRRVFTKRGIVALLMALFRLPEMDEDQKVLDLANDLLEKLGGMDGLQGFLLGFKAKSEGLMKSIKSIFK